LQNIWQKSSTPFLMHIFFPKHHEVRYERLYASILCRLYACHYAILYVVHMSGGCPGDA
jgi:hypothetical protein